MILDSPEKVCNVINTKLNLLDKPPHTHSYNNFFDWVVESVLKPKKVHVPIYTSSWKINLIKKLQQKIYSPEPMNQEGWYSTIDFSRLIWADGWKTYPFAHKMALPKFVKEYNDFWTVSLDYEFFQENLEFGVRPIRIYKYTVDLGGAQLVLAHKSSNKLYLIGGSSLIFIDFIQDFKLYLQGEQSSIHWEQRLIP